MNFVSETLKITFTATTIKQIKMKIIKTNLHFKDCLFRKPLLWFYVNIFKKKSIVY